MVFEEALHRPRFSFVSGGGQESTTSHVPDLNRLQRNGGVGEGESDPTARYWGQDSVPLNPENVSIAQQSHSRGVQEEHGGQG